MGWLAYGGVYSPYTYGYAAYPTAYSGLGYRYYGKRSADAEPEAKADPWYTTYGYGHHGYAGYGYGYPTVYSGYGHFYGKRSADAEPKADAYYGYYGYARPYGGYYGYARPYGYAYYG